MFYSPGILSNLYSIHNCDYNWLLGYIVFKQYNHLFNDKIDCFHVGFGNGGFILGMQYFFSNGAMNNTQIDWLGVDEKITKFAFNNSDNVVHGVICDNIMIHDTLCNIKVIINNKFNKVNLITNNILPILNKKKILISIAILVLSTLHPNGVLLTRILDPTYWYPDFIQYLLLFGMIFKNMEIFRYPVCKNKCVQYRYYLLCYYKKSVLYESKIYRKLLMLLENIDTEKLLFKQNIINTHEIDEWKKTVSDAQKYYIHNFDNPQSDLMDIVNKLTESLSDD